LVITQTVRAAGPGTYTAADVQLREGIGHGGWTIIVAYRERVAPEVRNLTVFDGRVGVQTVATNPPAPLWQGRFKALGLAERMD